MSMAICGSSTDRRETTGCIAACAPRRSGDRSGASGRRARKLQRSKREPMTRLFGGRFDLNARPPAVDEIAYPRSSCRTGAIDAPGARPTICPCGNVSISVRGSGARASCSPLSLSPPSCTRSVGSRRHALRLPLKWLGTTWSGPLGHTLLRSTRSSSRHFGT